MIRKTEILIIVFIVLNLCAVNLHAELVTIHITAEVKYVDDPGGLLEDKVTVGDAITGSYSYNSDTPDNNPMSSLGAYWHYSSTYGINLSVGGFVFQTDPDNVELLLGIDNGTYGHDTYHIISYNNLPLSNGVEVNHILWQLDDYSSAALSSDALPTTPPVLEDWESNYLLMTFGYKGGSNIQARVTNVIPEPATLLLLALGSLVLTRRRQ